MFVRILLGGLQSIGVRGYKSRLSVPNVAFPFVPAAELRVIGETRREWGVFLQRFGMESSPIGRFIRPAADGVRWFRMFRSFRIEGSLAGHTGVLPMPANQCSPRNPPSSDERDTASAACRWLEEQLSVEPPAGSSRTGLRLVAADKPRDSVALPASAAEFLLDALRLLASGQKATLMSQEAELTTQEVADYLRVSRPYVVRLIEENRLPARKVGSRRRVARQDMLRFDEQQRERSRAALDELARIDRELGL